ncbi:MAG: GIY-YIG nuclease family protein [Patescibacteria group bacterium]
MYFIYIMASKSGVLYTGVTNNLVRRVYEHKNSLIEGFSSKYKTDILVYYEDVESIESAIVREKQIKGLLRFKKEALVRHMNPEWNDLAEHIS